MKNLANCTPREFLRQTNRIRKSVKEWLTVTDVMNIRRRMPKVELAKDATEEERAELLRAQALKNVDAILEAALEAHPDETAELLGMLCFIEPEELDDHQVSELLGSFTELISCPEVIDFFTSLARLGTTFGLGAANP